MTKDSLPRYIILEKKVGETPLSCVETYRAEHPELIGIPLAYAGRLDPMASGQLLILVGEECKQQSAYHDLDKEYQFSVLFGISSDTQDVLGRLQNHPLPTILSSTSNDYQALTREIEKICTSLLGQIELPYPAFSSKTVQGKPLHTWALEGRLSEIEIPTKKSLVYDLTLTNITTVEKTELVEKALSKINLIPPVTEPSKALGQDFRRHDVRSDWRSMADNSALPTAYIIGHFSCIASSGTYMRTLASIIGQKLKTGALAWHIHRNKIGRFDSTHSIWTETF
jgi:tRNA pseudouridine(55) synthase